MALKTNMGELYYKAILLIKQTRKPRSLTWGGSRYRRERSLYFANRSGKSYL